jgi:hypothetical protein
MQELKNFDLSNVRKRRTPAKRGQVVSGTCLRAGRLKELLLNYNFKKLILYRKPTVAILFSS